MFYFIIFIVVRNSNYRLDIKYRVDLLLVISTSARLLKNNESLFTPVHNILTSTCIYLCFAVNCIFNCFNFLN